VLWLQLFSGPPEVGGQKVGLFQMSVVENSIRKKGGREVGLTQINVVQVGAGDGVIVGV
jgi:hypothetical protein